MAVAVTDCDARGDLEKANGTAGMMREVADVGRSDLLCGGQADAAAVYGAMADFVERHARRCAQRAGVSKTMAMTLPTPVILESLKDLQVGLRL